MEAYGDRTLYAVWAANTYTVNYDPNGGEGAMENSAHVYDAAGQLNENKFTRSDYVFIGWSLSKNGDNGKLYGDRDSVVNLTEESGTVTLYAQWEAIRYTITFETNGGEPMDPQYYTINDLPYALPVPVRAGFRFVGWYDQEDGEKTTVEAIPENSRGEKTYCAKWELEEYTASWSSISNGSVMVTRVSSPLANVELGVLNDGDIVYYGDKLEIKYTSDKGYHFEASGSDVFVRTLEVTRSLTADDITVTPILNGYVIIYDGTGGTPSIPSEIGVYGSNDKITATASWHGWIFLGWADANGNAVSERNPNWGAVNGETVVLYAQWQLITSYSYRFPNFEVNNSSSGAHGYYITLTDKFDMNYFRSHGYTAKISLSFTVSCNENYQLGFGMYNGPSDTSPKIFGNGVEKMTAGADYKTYTASVKCSALGNDQISFLFAETTIAWFNIVSKRYTVANPVMTISFTK